VRAQTISAAEPTVHEREHAFVVERAREPAAVRQLGADDALAVTAPRFAGSGHSTVPGFGITRDASIRYV
jgi:hypothetical protein